MGFYGNDLGTQGRQISNGSLEAVQASMAEPADPARRFRNAGWWPSGGTAAKVLLIGFLVIVGIGWALTLLN